MSEVIAIPDKRYFTISEASNIAQVKPHVLRYWEQEFPQLNPGKRTGRRYYQPKDIETICQIRHLLYDKGFTIQGARQELSGSKKPSEVLVQRIDKKLPQDVLRTLQSAVKELDNIAQQLKAE